MTQAPAPLTNSEDGWDWKDDWDWEAADRAVQKALQDERVEAEAMNAAFDRTAALQPVGEYDEPEEDWLPGYGSIGAANNA